MGPPVTHCQALRLDYPEAPSSPGRPKRRGVAPWVSRGVGQVVAMEVVAMEVVGPRQWVLAPRLVLHDGPLWVSF